MKSLPILSKMNDRPLYDEVFLCYNKTIQFVYWLKNIIMLNGLYAILREPGNYKKKIFRCSKQNSFRESSLSNVTY